MRARRNIINTVSLEIRARRRRAERNLNVQFRARDARRVHTRKVHRRKVSRDKRNYRGQHFQTTVFRPVLSVRYEEGRRETNCRMPQMRQALPSRRSPGVLLKEIDHQRRTKSRTAMPFIGVDTDLRVVPGLPEWNGVRNFDPALNESAKIALLLQHTICPRADCDLLSASLRRTSLAVGKQLFKFGPRKSH